MIRSERSAGEEVVVSERVAWVPFDLLESFMVDVFKGVGVPEDDALICADVLISADKRGIDSHEELKLEVIADLEGKGLIRREEVIESIAFDYDAAYPIYLLGYRDHVKRCLDYLDTIANLESTGRQGRFIYVNAHHTMNMGIEAARRVNTIS